MGIFVASDSNGLIRTRPSVFFRTDLYQSMWIVESSGRQYEAYEPMVSRPVSGLGLWLAKIFDLSIEVTFQLRETGMMTLPELVRRIKAFMDEDELIFEEISGKSVSSWCEELDGCKTIQDVILLFGD